MAEFLSESIRRTRFLQPGESIETEFNVVNPGNVVTIASAKWDRTFPPDPTKRLTEIFVPGSTEPAKRKLDEGWSTTTFLAHTAASSNAGRWKVRVTNRENSGELFRFNVSYPGTTEIKTLTLPIAIINTFLNATIRQITIKLTDGDNNSFIRFPASMNVPEQRFTLPRFSKKFNNPWPIPDITIKERVSNINSESIEANLVNAREGYVNGSIDMKVKFETSGREIRGTVDAHIGNMNLAVSLGLTVSNRRISYQTNNIGVSFPITINLVNVPDFIEDLIDGLTGFRNQLRSSVQNVVRSAFASSNTRQAITSALNDQVGTLLGAGAQIISAKVQGGNLVVRYFNT